MDDPPTLFVVGTPDWGIGEYKTTKGDSVLAATRALAQMNGWDLRYRWDDGTSAYRWTLYLPDRDDVISSEFTLDPGDVYEVPGLRVSREHVRNDFTGEHATGTSTRENAQSIADFRRQWMGISEPEFSAAQMDALLVLADSDLSDVHTEKQVRIPFLPWLELHDRLTIDPDAIRFTAEQSYAVTGVSHEVDAEGGASTVVSLRGGSPVGQYFAWLKRAIPGGPTDDDLAVAWRPVNKTPTSHTYRGEPLDTRVHEVWRYDEVVAQGVDASDTETLQGAQSPTVLSLSSGGFDLTLAVPDTDTVRYTHLVPYSVGFLPGPVVIIETDPVPPEAPTWEEDDSETATVGTRWVAVTERGLSVTAVRMASQTGRTSASTLGTPTRGPGDASVVKGGTLGALEYEQDVTLDAARLAWIWGEIEDETGGVQALTPLAFDRDTQPTFVSVAVEGQKVIVIADSDTESIILTRTDGGGTWSKAVDSFSHAFDLSKPDPSGNSAIGTAETWTVEVTARSDPGIAVDGSTLTETVIKTVDGESSGGAGGEKWEIVSVTATAPADDLTAEISLKAEVGVSGTEIAKVYGRNVNTETWTDITASLSPSLSTPPTTLTTYTYDVPEPDGSRASWQFRAEISDGGVVSDSTTERATWLFAEPV